MAGHLVRGYTMGASCAGILPSLLCAAVVSAFGLPSPGFAQGNGTVFVSSVALTHVEGDIQRGCRYRDEHFPNTIAGVSMGTLVGIFTESESGAAPISSKYYQELMREWRRLKVCKGTEPAIENPTLPALEENPVPRQVRPAEQVAGAAPDFTITPAATVNVDFADFNSATTFTSPTDTLKVHSHTSQIQIAGYVDVGSWFASVSVGFAGAPRGSLTDTFPDFPAANFSGTVNSGSVYHGVADVGYNVIQQRDLRVGVFAGYYFLGESLYGTFGMSDVQTSLEDNRWQAGRLGIKYEQSFGGGFTATLDLEGMPVVDLQSGELNAHGEGAAGGFRFSFPVFNSSLRGNVFVEDTYMRVSGISWGIPMTVKNNNVTVGAGLTAGFPPNRMFLP
jgi:hypothetical protein